MLFFILLIFALYQAKAQCPSNLNFSINGNLCVGNTISFDNVTSSSPGGNLIFEVDDNTISSPPYTYTFNMPGSYEVILRRVDPSGCSNQTTRTIEIESYPVANFTFSSDNNNPPCSDDLIQFTT